ncbi:MAG: FAD:protein FMN transferase [Burkholderiaceae bacterium]|nr:FAD:protein FMN transferase [Burkholderiaceae bacterium]
MFDRWKGVLTRAAGALGGRVRVSAGWVSREEAIMGTSVRVELWSEDRDDGEAAIAAVMERMHQIDETMSPYKPDSELTGVNRAAADAPVAVSREMYDIVSRSIEYSRMSDGAFDITYASAGHLYDYRLGIRPAEDDLARARAAIGWRNLVLDPDACTIRFARPGVRIDLGGFAKGYAVDEGAAILRSRGVCNAIVTAGGDSHIVGDRRGRPWAIGIRDPRRAGQMVAVLPLQDVALSTSGDYERYFEDGGVRYHHVIDPATGRSPLGVRSVTVIAPDGLTSEALAKSVFVMGVDRGMRLIESLEGVDAVVVDAAGALHHSAGLLPGRARARH